MTHYANDKATEVAASKPGRKPAQAKTSNHTRPLTTKVQLIKLLSSRSGATVGALAEKLVRQAHTVRAALSGLRRAAYEIATDVNDSRGMKLYRRAAATPELSAVPASSAPATVSVGGTGQ